MSTRGMFRMTEVQPFDPGLLGIHAMRINGCSNRAGASVGVSSSERPPMYSGGQWDEEKMGLLDGRPKRDRMSLSSAITLCAAVSLWFLIILVIFIMYWQLTSSVATLRDTARPFVLEMVNHTMSILYHADHSMVGVNDMADGAASLSNQAVPAMRLALNQTSAMIARLEALAQHPVLQLSLTQGQVGPVGR